MLQRACAEADLAKMPVKIRSDAYSMNLRQASEQKLMKRVLARYSRLYDVFNFVVEPALGPDPRGWDYLIYCNVDRISLGLEPAGKPGDVDVLIVPIRGNKPEAENSMAIEVKRLYLPSVKRSRDTNSSGAEQAKGLVQDGFPIVGILHLVIAEPSPRNEWQRGLAARVLDEFGNVEILPDEVMIDPINTDAPRRQLERLEQRIRTPTIGLNSLCLNLSEDGRRIRGTSVGASRRAQRNSIRNPNLLHQIEKFCASVPAPLPDQITEDDLL